MSKIEVKLYGNPEIWMDGEAVSFPYKKAEGFFYYLCMKKKVSRDEVVNLLWADEGETAGKKKLRDVIYQIRRGLGRDSVLTEGHVQIALNPACMPVLLENSGTESFLEHFYIKNCYEFEEWAESVRQEQQQKSEKLLREKLREAAERRDSAGVQEYGMQLLARDPCDEELAAELMELYAGNGSYVMAIRLFHDVEKKLKEEFDAEPSAELVALFHRIYNMKEQVGSTDASPQEPAFFVRKKELYEISRFLEARPDRKERCLVISGEEGVGKSALLQKGIRLAQGNSYMIFYAPCYRQEDVFFLRPWLDILRTLQQYIQEKRLPEVFSRQQIEQLAEVLEKGHAETVILPLFARLAEKRRVLLVFDDMHCMDNVSCQYLNQLFLNDRTGQLLLLGTCEKLERDQLTQRFSPLMRREKLQALVLQPFTREEAREILRRQLPELKNDEEKLDTLYSLSDGNAFLLNEMILLIQEKGYTLEKSERINTLLRTRLMSLSEEEREILGCISIFPGKCEIEELELLLGSSDRLQVLRRLDQLAAKLFITEELIGWNVYYRFTHRMFHEYVYENLSNGKKQCYHRMVGEYYEKRESESYVYSGWAAYHFQRCHQVEKEYRYALHYLKSFFTVINENFPVLTEDAAENSERIVFSDEAEEMRRLAERVIGTRQNSPEIRRMKMEMYYIKGRYDIAMGDYDEGAEAITHCLWLLDGEENRKMRLACYRQFIFAGIQQADLELVRSYLDKGFAETDPAERDEYGAFLRLQGWYHLHSDSFDVAQGELEQAYAIFRELNQDTDRYVPSLVACLNYMGDIRLHRQNYEQALEIYRKAISACGSLEFNGIGQVYNSIGEILCLQKKYGEAREYLEKAKLHLGRHGYLWGLEWAEVWLARVCFESGEPEQGKKHLKKAEEWNRRIKYPVSETLIAELKEKYGLAE